MNSAIRILIAIIVSPLAAIPMVLIFVVVSGVFFDHEKFEFGMNFSQFAPYALIIAYPATLLFGLPAHLGLRLLKQNKIWCHSLLGALSGIGFIFVLLPDPREDWSIFLLYGVLFTSCATAVATTFGVITKQKLSPESAA